MVEQASEDTGVEKTPSKSETKTQNIIKHILFTALIIAIFVGVWWVFIKDVFPEYEQIIIFLGIILIFLTFFIPVIVPERYKKHYTIFVRISWIITIVIFLWTTPLPEKAYAAFKTPLKEAGKYFSGFKCMLTLGLRGGDISQCWEPEPSIEKIGNYETLSLELGRKIDSQTLPIRTPECDKEYTLEFTLTNENDPNSKFDIDIQNVEAYALTKTYYKDSDLTGIPASKPISYTLRPQKNLPVRVDFNTIPRNYVYFFVKTTSKQSGGGSSYFGMVPSEEEYEDFVYEFNPMIKTNPGPLDIYVYTDPPVIVLDKEDMFDVLIKLVNKGKDGVGSVNEVTIIQTFEDLDSSTPKDDYPFRITCDNYPEIDCPEEKAGNCITISIAENILEKDEVYEISCNATVKSGYNLRGKVTDLISVLSDYDYVQEFSPPPVKAVCPEDTGTTLPGTTIPTTFIPVSSTDLDNYFAWKGCFQMVGLSSYMYEASERTGISPLIFAAIPIQEGGCVDGTFASNAICNPGGSFVYNLYGIKWTEGCGFKKCERSRDGELFRGYNSKEESIDDFARLITKTNCNYEANGCYKEAMEYKDDPNMFVRMLAKHGYAEESEWSGHIITIMNQINDYISGIESA